MLLLKILWLRAADILCRPGNRAAFHSAVLVLALGGFRFGITLGMPYRDTQFLLVRNKKNRTKAQLVVTITIYQNKQKINVLRENQKHI
jgi:hypothetical protein